jgi:hypothetical protein
MTAPIPPTKAPAASAAASVGAVVLALVGALLAATAPRGVLVVVLLPIQVLLAAGWLTLAAVPARTAGVVVATGAGLAADLLIALRPTPGLGALAGVVGLGVVAAVLGQLLRSERSRVTDVLAAQCSAVLLTVAVSPPLALAAITHGGRDVAAALVALALTVAAGEVGALLLPRHRLPGRAGLGFVVGAGAGAAFGVLFTHPSGPVVAVVAAAATVLAELVVGVAAADRTVVRPLGALLPFALMAPGVYVVGRVMLG